MVTIWIFHRRIVRTFSRVGAGVFLIGALLALYSGIAVLALGLPMVASFDTGEDYGTVPDGISHGNDSTAAAEESKTFTPQISLSWRQAIRSTFIWLISIGHGLSLLTVSSMLAHLIPHLTNGLGYAPVQAGVAFALMTMQIRVVCC